VFVVREGRALLSRPTFSSGLRGCSRQKSDGTEAVPPEIPALPIVVSLWTIPFAHDRDKPSGPAKEAYHLTKRPMTRALAMSIKKADTSGRMMKAVGAAPCTFVTAVMLAMAVGVAPRLMPLKPAEITAAR
jgi:hypothetical protein